MKRLLLVMALLLGCVGCDQATKVAARAHLSDAPAISYLHDTVRLTYAENIGAFLSLGASMPSSVRTALFQGIVGLLVVGMVAAALLWPGLSRAQIVAVTLLGASGFGNLIDRLLYDGRVTDFLNIGIGHFRTGIFNVADILGVVAIFVLLLFRSRVALPGSHVQR